MIEQLVNSIKKDKKLSLNHWRYKLLHWCFNEHCEKAEDSKLPKCLYTHFCPLFHITNLIAIFSPAILAGKMIWAIGAVIVTAAQIIWGWIRVLFKPIGIIFRARKHLRRARAIVQEAQADKEEQRREAKHNVVNFLLDASDEILTDPERIKSYGFAGLSQDEVIAIWQKYAPRILEARKAAAARRAKMQERIAFWSRFSHAFVKIILNLFYAALVVGTLFLTFRFGVPTLIKIGTFFAWMFRMFMSVNFLWLLSETLYWGLRLAAAAGVLVLIYIVLRKLKVFSNKAYRKAFIPFRAAGEMFGDFLGWIVDTADAIREFVSVFYEENCPKIEVVDDTEAAIAAVEEK